MKTEIIETVNVEPLALTIPQAVMASNLSRSTLYALIEDGSLKSVSIRRKGMSRGRRLIPVESLREFINRAAA